VWPRPRHNWVSIMQEWESIFPASISSSLGSAVEAIDRVASQTEVLSMFPEKYSDSDIESLSVHSFYLKKCAAQLETDFLAKASCLNSLRRNHEPPQGIGLSTHDYERMIESRLLDLAPVVDRIIKTETEEGLASRDADKLTRYRRLLKDITDLADFFRTGANPSPWIRFTDALARLDEKSADQALRTD